MAACQAEALWRWEAAVVELSQRPAVSSFLGVSGLFAQERFLPSLASRPLNFSLARGGLAGVLVLGGQSTGLAGGMELGASSDALTRKAPRRCSNPAADSTSGPSVIARSGESGDTPGA